jgi:hypothetical protein
MKSSFVSLRLSLANSVMRYQGHTAINAETASHIPPQSPSDRSRTAMSATPGASLGMASRAAASG